MDDDTPIIRDGIDQAHRFPKALAPGYFNVDESTFESLAAMVSDFSGCVRYVSLENRSFGNWKSLFTSDEAMIFALISGFDIQQQMTLFSHLSDHMETRGLVRLNYVLARHVNDWYEHLSAINSSLARECCRRIRHLINKELKSDLMVLKPLCQGYDQAEPEPFMDFTPFSSIWESNNSQDISMEDEEAALGFLTSCFYRLHAGVLLLKEHAAVLLELSLTSQSHPPGTGMFLSFLHLYGHIRDTQNLFTMRHLDFYYNGVLHSQDPEATPDRAHLCVKKNIQSPTVSIPKGTCFPAPPDKDSHPKIYQSDHDLFVTNVQVVALKTLLYDRDKLISPESDLDMVTSARISNLPVPNTMDFKVTDTGSPIFGASGDRSMVGANENASFGFAVSTPVLLLREGVRKVVVSLSLDHLGPDPEKGGLFSEFLKQSAALSKTSTTNMFYKVFSKIFRISLTTDQGWFEVDHYIPGIHLVDRECKENQLSFSFQLDVEAPGIIPWCEEIHGRGYDTDFPVMRLVINPESYVYPCSILEDYFIRDMAIQTRVTGVRDLVLYNHQGRLDPNTPFPPFGALGEKGSYFIVGAYETAVKPLTEFEVNLEWGGLPSGKGGFTTHYQAYDLGIDNSGFLVAGSRLTEGQWMPDPLGQPETMLFMEDSQGRVGGHSRLTTQGIDLSLAGPIQTPEADYRFDIRARSGFIKFTLAGPKSGFGHQEYPLLLTRTLTRNAKLGRFAKPKDLPNVPYTPMVNRVSVDYRAGVCLRPGLAASSTDRKQGVLYSIHPFGIRQTFPLARQQRCFMIPDEHKQGYGNLFMGLSKLVPGTRLSLFFHLLDDSRAPSTTSLPFVTWFYLKGNQWERFTKKQVATDTTAGFLTSGIVALDIPEDMNKETSLFEENLYWIRACANKNLTGASSLFTVQTHGVQVTLKEPDSRTGVLAVGSIKEALSPLPGITKITQPLPSFGGRLGQDGDNRKTRMGERLKHKNRAVTPWDYERLVLENFSGIQKVKCFPGINGQAWHSEKLKIPDQPGCLLICIIPEFEKGKTNLIKDPEPLANAILLSRIKAFLEKRSSAFVSIEVRNPVYEKIQIRCTVRFKENANLWGNKRKLNKAISQFISPWTPTGYKAGFGWRISRSDLISFIQEQAYVDFVTQFSMLKISWDSQDRFELFDTMGKGTLSAQAAYSAEAAHSAPGTHSAQETVCPDQGESQIRPKYPWSIAINADHHFIRPTSQLKPITPQKTGVEELEVGNTFIITG